MYKYLPKKTLLLMSSLVLTACVSVGPDYNASTTPESDVIIAQQIKFDSRASLWWEQFNEPTLNRLIELALQYNQTLEAARANVTAAYALFDDAETAGWPEGGPNLGYNAQKQATPGVNEQRVDIRSYRAGAQLTWSLDLFGKLRRAAEAALADAQAQQFAWYDLQVSLSAQIAQTYVQLKGSKARILVAENNIDRLQKMRSIINARVDAGFASELDLHRIDAELYGVKASIPGLESTAERAKYALVALVGGKAVLTDIDWGKLDDNLPGLDSPLAIGDPRDLLRRRADLHAAERELAAATATIGINVADLYPDLSVTGFLGFLAGDFSSLGDSGTKAWSVAPSLSWSVFNLNSIQAQIDVANARQKGALANFKQKTLEAVSQAQSALSDYAKMQQQRHLLSAQTQASRDALRLAQARYDAGAIDFFDVLDVERALLAAEDSLVQSKIRTFTAIIAVYQAFGGGFEPEEVI